MELTQTNLVSTDKDCQLEVIAGLTWLPWVGSNYYNAQYRVLIVGESHYCIGDNIEAEMAERDGQNTDKTIRFVRRTLRNLTMRRRGR